MGLQKVIDICRQRERETEEMQKLRTKGIVMVEVTGAIFGGGGVVKSIIFLEGSQASLVRPSDMGSVTVTS
jgi:hypothetical protein